MKAVVSVSTCSAELLAHHPLPGIELASASIGARRCRRSAARSSLGRRRRSCRRGLPVARCRAGTRRPEVLVGPRSGEVHASGGSRPISAPASISFSWSELNWSARADVLQPVPLHHARLESAVGVSALYSSIFGAPPVLGEVEAAVERRVVAPPRAARSSAQAGGMRMRSYACWRRRPHRLEATPVQLRRGRFSSSISSAVKP